MNVVCFASESLWSPPQLDIELGRRGLEAGTR